MVALIAILGAVGVAVYSGAFASVTHTKLEHDARTLNQAVTMYLGSGGSLEGVATAEEVVAKLKTIRARADALTYVGAGTGRLVDPRLVAVPQSAKEAADGEPRVTWDLALQRFKVAYGGAAGVKQFILDDSLANSLAVVEERDDAGYDYKTGNGWVWDGKTNWKTLAKTQPSKISTTQYPDGWVPPVEEPNPGPGGGGGSGGGSGSGGGGTTTPPNPEPPVQRLAAPTISPSKTMHPIEQFPLQISLGGLPSPSLGIAQYRVGSGQWMNYTGPFTVPPATTVYYKAVSLDTTVALDSSTLSRTFYGTQGSFTGSSDLSISNVVGGPNLDYQVGDSGGEVMLSHGNPRQDLGGEIVDSGSPNTLRMQEGSFSDVALGASFQLSDMQIHNGTTFNDSHATSGQVNIAFTIPSLGVSLNVPLSLTFVNTENSEDRAASADYVIFNNLPRTVSFKGNDGTTYKLNLRLQSTNTANGYIVGDREFHVYEGATALGSVMGTITN